MGQAPSFRLSRRRILSSEINDDPSITSQDTKTPATLFDHVGVDDGDSKEKVLYSPKNSLRLIADDRLQKTVSPRQRLNPQSLARPRATRVNCQKMGEGRGGEEYRTPI